MIKKLLAEAIGTFMVVFVGCGAIVLGLSHLVICLVFGLIVMTMILCFGKVSGCYINTSVTIAEWMRKKIGTQQALLYIIVQIIGAITAGFFLKSVAQEGSTLGATLPRVPLWQAFAIEVVISAGLFAIILFITHRTHNLLLVASFIGFTVFALAYLAGPYTGASMNPARSIGPAIAAGLWSELWLYITAPTIGMAIVAILFHRRTPRA